MLARVSASREPQPAFRRLPRAVREQQMLDAAVKVFARRGFQAASMDDIAEDAGISKPMVYAYLGTKEELFRACLQREGTRLITAVADEVVLDVSPDEQLWRGLRAFFGFVAANRDGWAVLYRQARARQPFAGELAAMRQQMVLVVTGMLERAVHAQGSHAGGTEVEVTAYALVGAGESLADWMIDHPVPDPDKTATQLMNFAWLGAGQLLRGTAWRPPPG